jgi:hypothetical protein
MNTQITHYLQVQADHGAWVDHLALWSCRDLAAAQRRADEHPCQFPDRPHRLIEMCPGGDRWGAGEDVLGMGRCERCGRLIGCDSSGILYPHRKDS